MKRAGLLLVLLALLLGNIYFATHQKIQKVDIATEKSNKYPLIARRIFADNPNDTIINFTPVRDIIDQQFSTSSIPHSVYFEYLPTGITVRDKAETQLIAASLIKLPLVMNLYHVAEEGKLDLDKKVQLKQEDLDKGYGDLYKKGAGYSLTLRDAAKIALTRSDNTAAMVIRRNALPLLPEKEEALFRLDVDYSSQGSEAIFNSRSYTSILTCLYYSCYLKPASSQEILNYLTQDVYKERLTKNIPESVKVAHKFGTYDDLNTYSDCGIFYVPKRPYTLCILMQGDQRTINTIMADTSKKIYDAVINL